MGLRDLIQGAVQAAFTSIGGTGGLTESITYTSVTIGAYNPTTGAAAETTTATTVSDAVLVQFTARELQGGTFAGSASTSIQPTDLKLLLNASAYTITPRLTDRITRADASVWQVVNYRLEPSGSVYVIQIRLP